MTSWKKEAANKREWTRDANNSVNGGSDCRRRHGRSSLSMLEVSSPSMLYIPHRLEQLLIFTSFPAPND